MTTERREEYEAMVREAPPYKVELVEKPWVKPVKPPPPPVEPFKVEVIRPPLPRTYPQLTEAEKAGMTEYELVTYDIQRLEGRRLEIALTKYPTQDKDFLEKILGFSVGIPLVKWGYEALVTTRPTAQEEELDRITEELKLLAARAKALDKEQFFAEPTALDEPGYFDEAYDARTLAQLLAEVPKPKPIGLHMLSTQEIFTALRTTYAPTLPEGMTTGDLRSMLLEQGYEEEDIPELIEFIEGVAADPVAAWEEREKVWDDYMNGLVYMTRGIPWTKKLQLLAMSPMLALGKTLDPYFSWVSRPIAGNLILLMSALTPGDQEIEKLFDEARAEHNIWYASGQAFEDWGMNWGVKLVTEVLVDPASYFGLGIYTHATKGIPIVGRGVGAAEMGFLRAVDLPFLGIKSWWARRPKTVPQVAKMRAQTTTTRAMAYPRQALGKNVRQISYVEARGALEEALNIARAFPAAQGDGAVIGKLLLEMHQAFASPEDLAKFGRAIGIKVEKPTAQQLSDVTYYFETTYGAAGATVHTPEEAAKYIIGVLGGKDTKKNIQAITKLLNARNEATFNSTKLTLEADSIKELYGKIYNRAYQDIVGFPGAPETGKAASPVFLKREQVGVTGALLHKFESNFLNTARLGFDRHLVMPFAKSYLMFMNYGLPNVFEAWFKGGFGKAGWRVRVGDSQVDLFQRVWGHMPNAPYDITSFVPRKGWRAVREAEAGEFRLEIMATQVGRESIMQRVMAPNLLGEMPGVGAMVRRMPVAGKRLADIPVAKLLIDPWGEMSMQRYAYCLRSWMKRGMMDEAPEVVKPIERIFSETAMPPGIEKELADSIRDVGFELAIADIRQFRELPTMLTADRIATAELRTAFEPFLEIEQAYKEMVLKQAESGALWAKGGTAIDEYFGHMATMMNEAYLKSPEIIAVKYRALADAVKSQGIASYDDWFRAMQTLDIMTDNFHRHITLFRSLGKKEGELIRDIAAKDVFFESLEKRLNLLVDDATKAMGDLRQTLIGNLEASGMATDDVARAVKALDGMASEWGAAATARAEQLARHDALKVQYPISARRNKAVNDEFWARWWEGDAEAWKNYHPFRRDTARPAIDRELDALSRVKYPRPIDTAARDLTVGDIAHLWQTTPDNVKIGFFDFSQGTISMTKDEFIMATQNRAARVCRTAGVEADAYGYTAERIGLAYDNILLGLRIDPTKPIPELLPRMMELESMRDLTWRTFRTKSIPEEQLAKIQTYVDDVSGRIEKITGYGTDEYRNAQIRAMDNARKTYSITFADYDPAGLNALDDIIRSIMPYWPYELHRPFWLLRNFIRYPGMPLTVGRFNNYTDRGYVHIPGTSVEVNPFRGTIFGPVLTRMTMRDYPEYYDLFPGMSQGVDVLGKYGFYPGIQFQFLNTMFGYASTGVRPQLGMLLPSWMKTPLNVLLATMPSDATKILTDVFFPDFFRDYLTLLAVSRRGYEGSVIYEKRLLGRPLTPEEEKVWEDARREVAMHGIYFEQVAVFRFRTEEQIAAWDAATKVIEERMGIPRELLDEMRQYGLRISDYYIPIDPETQRILNELEAVKIWSGVTVPLQPTQVQKELARRALFWNTVEKQGDDYEIEQTELDRQFLAGEITSDSWRFETSNLIEKRSNFIEELKQREYPDVPITLEEIIAWYEEKGQSVPTFHPERELMFLYYSIKPEKSWDDESETWAWDWNRYYAQVDAIINVLPPALKQQFIKDITASMSDMRRLQWFVNREYIRPYRNAFYLNMELYSDEEQRTIREWYRTASTERRNELEEIMRDGEGLISGFRAALRTMRQNIRSIDPELDAWLYFFGHTQTWRTDRAKELYYSLCKQYNKVP